MPTSPSDIRRWLQEGQRRGATHVIVVTDTYDHVDWPVYVMSSENVREQYNESNGQNMQRVQEVYALHLDWEEQLLERRAFHFEEPPEAEEVFEEEPPAARDPRVDRVALVERILELIDKEPWLSAAVIANRLKTRPGTVSSILIRLLRLNGEDGPLVRERGRGPRGGFGYMLRVPLESLKKKKQETSKERLSRYDLLNLDDWL